MFVCVFVVRRYATRKITILMTIVIEVKYDIFILYSHDQHSFVLAKSCEKEIN